MWVVGISTRAIGPLGFDEEEGSESFVFGGPEEETATVRGILGKRVPVCYPVLGGYAPGVRRRNGDERLRRVLWDDGDFSQANMASTGHQMRQQFFTDVRAQLALEGADHIFQGRSSQLLVPISDG